MKPPQKRPRGRPPADATMQQIAIRLPTTLIDEIDEMVAELKADPLARAERSAVIRSLLQTALEQRRSKKRKQ